MAIFQITLTNFTKTIGADDEDSAIKQVTEYLCDNPSHFTVKEIDPDNVQVQEISATPDVDSAILDNIEE